MPPLDKQNLQNKLFLTIVAVSMALSVGMTVATWRMNFWPTDAEDYYISAAVRLPHLDFVSQMHEAVDEAKKKWLHGKEMFIVNAAITQRLFNDYVSLRPLVFVCIVSVGLSLILAFLLARHFWGKAVGLICFALFAFSFWPYVYILFVKHQTLGLFYFLLSVVFLHYRNRCRIPSSMLLFMSGVTLCFSFHASTTSVLYISYYAGAFLYYTWFAKGAAKDGETKPMGKLFLGSIWVVIGFVAAFIYFNYPNIVYNVKGYLDYVKISKSYSHFYYNQPVLIQWISHPELSVRGGWLWVFKYFMIIMPVLFPTYLFCLCYLCGCCLTVKVQAAAFRLQTLSIILLSVSSPLLAEIRGVAQYGANYFTSFIGILILVGYALYVFLNSEWFKRSKKLVRQAFWSVIGLILVLHAVVNIYVFASDVYPSRMATTFISNKIKTLGLKDLYSYMEHPSRRNMIDCLDPSLLEKLHFVGIKNIYQTMDGYILVSPVTGHSIYLDVTRNAYNDFDKDIYLNELVRKGNLKDYALSSFDTLASSRIWLHEEEVLTYKALILNQITPEDRHRGKALLLDAQKLQKDFKENMPSVEYRQLIFSGIRNIGTQRKVYVYEGEMKHVERPTLMKSFVMQIYKVGNPEDGLKAYIYKIADDEPVWIPHSVHFSSQMVAAKEISDNPAGQPVKFSFPHPLALIPGPYRIVVYRTGKASDNDFYRIYINDPEVTQAAIKDTEVLVR